MLTVKELPEDTSMKEIKNLDIIKYLLEEAHYYRRQ